MEGSCSRQASLACRTDKDSFQWISSFKLPLLLNHWFIYQSASQLQFIFPVLNVIFFIACDTESHVLSECCHWFPLWKHSCFKRVWCLGALVHTLLNVKMFCVTELFSSAIYSAAMRERETAVMWTTLIHFTATEKHWNTEKNCLTWMNLQNFSLLKHLPTYLSTYLSMHRYLYFAVILIFLVWFDH